MAFVEMVFLVGVAYLGAKLVTRWHTRRLPAPAKAKALPEGEERGFDALMVGDVVQHLATDYLVEGVLTMRSADGAQPLLARLVDGADERFLFVNAEERMLLRRTELPKIEGAPSDQLVHEGAALRLRQLLKGPLAFRGPVLSGIAAGQSGTLAIYGSAILVVIMPSAQWSFVGERVSSQSLELLPGR